MFWNDKEVVLKSGSATKTTQILQLLLYYFPQRVSSSALIDQVFSNDDILSPSNNLKASISLLRRQLIASILPAADYISFKDGGYIWSPSLVPEVDVHTFEKAVKRAESAPDSAGKIRLYQTAVALYNGAFLPGLIGVDWASTLDVYYGELYASAVRKLTGLLFESERYEDVLPLAEQAFRALRTEEWQILRMQCLMKLGRWDEAKQVYMDAVATMTREYDISPSEELIAQYRLISSQLSNALGTFHDMLDTMKEEEDVGGAYFCTYPGFIDSCRITARNMSRSGASCYLMLCSVCDVNGNVLQSENRLEEASNKLRGAIQKSLRRSDFFTQYNKSQFLIFLVGTSREHCSTIEMRIENNFRTLAVRGVRLIFELNSAILSDFDTGPFGDSRAPLAWHAI